MPFGDRNPVLSFRVRFPAFRRIMRVPAAFLLLCASAWAQVRVTVSDTAGLQSGTYHPKVRACNESGFPVLLAGWKFRSGDTGIAAAAGLTKQRGSEWTDYTQKPAADRPILPAGACTDPITYTEVQPGALTHGLLEPQALLSIGTCAEPLTIKEAPALACADLGTLPDYDEGRCYKDIPAENRLGGFLASFADRTQIQSAMPSPPFALSGQKIQWDPRSLGGPQYMMALAAAQELFGVDMRFLAAMAGKETRFGFVETGKEHLGSVSEWAMLNRDDDHTFSPWEIEPASFYRTMQSYPRFFPGFGPCLGKYPDAASGASCLGKDPDSAAAFYMRTPGYSSPTRTLGDSPQLASSAVAIALGLYWIYDALANAADLHFNQALASRKDPRVGLAAVIPGYNLGPYSGFEAPLRSSSIASDPNASSKFPMGNANYRSDLFAILDAFAAADSASMPCGGSNPLYDAAIPFEEVQRFFFGGNKTPGTPAAQGDGGLLLHFDMTAAERQALLAELQCAFAALKGKAYASPGKEAISYRYDWLTMLRVAKRLLPDRKRPLPVNADFRHILDANGANPTTAGGKIKDTVHPYLNNLILTAGSGTVAMGGFFKGYDAGARASSAWSLDPNALEWVPAQLPEPGDKLARAFEVPCGSKGFPKPGEKGTLWIRVTDDCGNATVQALDFTVRAGACGDPMRAVDRPGTRKAALAVRLERRSGRLVFVLEGTEKGAKAIDVRGRAMPGRSRHWASGGKAAVSEPPPE
jgi:hypothetical protein